MCVCVMRNGELGKWKWNDDTMSTTTATATAPIITTIVTTQSPPPPLVCMCVGGWDVMGERTRGKDLSSLVGKKRKDRRRRA